MNDNKKAYQLKKGLILFGKQRSAQGARCRLYFTEAAALHDDAPRICFLSCPNKKLFEMCMPGNNYDVSYKKNRLRDLTEAASIELTEDDYLKLLQQRDHTLGKDQPAPRFRLFQAASPGYYRLNEIRQIFAFHPSVYQKAFYRSLCHVSGFVSLVVPFLIFTYSLYYFTYIFMPAHFFGYQYFILLPLFYFVSLPFLIFIMTFAYHIGENVLLRYKPLKWFLLIDHIHQTGGQRMGVVLNERQKTRLFWFGLVSTAAYILFWIIVLVIR